MKKWVSKLLEQFEIDYISSGGKDAVVADISEDRATLLFLIDIYNKHLLEIDNHPVRKVRESLDEFAKGLMGPDADKILFRFRQFFSSYRIDEYSYIKKTFDDFKLIIWDFADQLSDEVEDEKVSDREVTASLEELREAVESNSIESLRSKSREFIDFYVEHQSRKDDRRTRRLDAIEKNLDVVKQKLHDANKSMREDHLTGAYNRRSFDEHVKKCIQNHKANNTPYTMIALDIDFFKKINDTYGHDVGDVMLKECVRLLKESFNRESDFVARIGGEEFVIVAPGYELEAALMKAEMTMNKIRKEVFVQGENQVRFTVSMGIAQYVESETPEVWHKRADTALYNSKQTGRNKYTIAPDKIGANKVA